MKGIDLLILKTEHGFTSNKDFYRALGISQETFYQSLLKSELPRPLSLACAALNAGLPPYSPPKNFDQEKLRLESASTIRWMAANGAKLEDIYLRITAGEALPDL